MARNSKPMIKIRTENKRHEDKIANVLKSMKERKDRRRISLDDRLRRMELMVKKQEKVRQNKTSTKKVVVKEEENRSLKTSRREKVPTAKFLEYKKNSKPVCDKKGSEVRPHQKEKIESMKKRRDVILNSTYFT